MLDGILCGQPVAREGVAEFDGADLGACAGAEGWEEVGEGPGVAEFEGVLGVEGFVGFCVAVFGSIRMGMGLRGWGFVGLLVR